jgi:DNA-binding NtrC family response regulator
MRSASYLDESGVLSINGDLSQAIGYAEQGTILAKDSGWSKGIVAGAANLAFLHLRNGSIEEAQKQLRVAATQTFSSASFACALTETEANAAIATGDFEKAETLLRQCQQPSSRIPIWYRLKAAETLVRVLLKTNRPQDAFSTADASFKSAAMSGLHPFTVSFHLAKITAASQVRGESKPEEIPFESLNADSPPSLHGEMCMTVASALLSVSPSASSAWNARAARIFSGIGSDRPDSVDPRLAALDAGGEGRVGFHPDLDTAVALLELSGHPHILGREAFALIRSTACTDAATLVTSGAGGTHVVDAIGWTPEIAARKAATPAEEGIEHLPIGTRGEEMWTLIVQPKRELVPYCTFASIRKLLAVALSLDAYRREEKQRAALWPADSLDTDPDCIWASEQMNETLNIARRIAPTPLPVLITGETGTGKEMIARAIHRASDRGDKQFLPFNCTAVPRDLLESQLFGYREGAFTGAETSFPGVIRSAIGGTLFLDEIGEIGPDVQPKLLRFLETQEIHPLGEPHPIKVDVRVVAATNASVEQLVASGRFREDLFYRLNVVRLSLAPLRERREEIPPLVQHYVRKYGDEYKKGRLTMGDDTLEYLLLFSWPGNVRQLANEVRRMVALAEPDSTLTPVHLSPEIQASRRTIPAASAAEPEVRVALDQPLPAAVEMLEQLMVRRALDRTHGRVEEASRLLGISRKGLFLKRRRWGFGQAS